MTNHRKTRAEQWLHLLPRAALVLAETEDHLGHGGLQPSSNTSRSFYMHLRNIQGSPSHTHSVKRIPVLQQQYTFCKQLFDCAKEKFCKVFAVWNPELRRKMLSIPMPISSRECSLFEFYLKLFSYSRSLQALIKIISLMITMTLDKCSSWKIFSNNSENFLAEYHTSHVSQNTTPVKRYPLLRLWVAPFQRDHGNATSSVDRNQHAFMPCLNCHPLSEALRGRISTLH